MHKEIKIPEMIRLLIDKRNLTMKELGELIGKSKSAVSY